MKPLMFLFVFLFKCLDVAGSNLKVGFDERSESMDICSVVQRNGFRIVPTNQKYPDRISFEFTAMPGFQVLFTPEKSKQVMVDVTVSGFEFKHADYDPWIGSAYVYMSLILPRDYTCSECQTGYKASTQTPPYKCELCQTTPRKIFEKYKDTSTVRESLDYQDVCDQNMFKPCPASPFGFYVTKDDVMPTSRDDCTRFHRCDKGQYKDPKFSLRQCLSCQDHSTAGFRGINAEPAKDKSRFRREDTCVCPRGSFFDEQQDKCRLCVPGTYTDQNNRTFCEPCQMCKALHSYGSQSCDACQDGLYWSPLTLRCMNNPRTWDSLQHAGVFEPCTDHDKDTVYIDIGPGLLDGSAGTCSQTLKCENYIKNRTKCGVGERAVYLGDDRDHICLRCQDGKYMNETAHMHKECIDESTCPGEYYVLFVAEKGHADIQCVLDNVTDILYRNGPWKYPVKESPAQVSYSIDDRRLQAVGGSMRECTKPPQTNFIVDSLPSLWRRNEIKLPLPETDTDCRFDCEAGTVKTAAGCEQCLAGKFYDTSSSSCVDCAPGSVSQSDGASDCELCSPGKYQNLPGKTACHQCEEIKVSQNYTCNPEIEYLTDECIEEGRKIRNCMSCENSEKLAVEGSHMWNRYGKEHCIRNCNAGEYHDENNLCQTCAQVADSNGFKTESEWKCKPDCNDGFEAVFNLSASAWKCNSCSLEAGPCPDGYRKSEENLETSSSGCAPPCTSCVEYLDPYTEYDSTRASEENPCAFVCRDGYKSVQELVAITGRKEEFLIDAIKNESTFQSFSDNTIKKMCVIVDPTIVDNCDQYSLTPDFAHLSEGAAVQYPYDTKYQKWPKITCAISQSLDSVVEGIDPLVVNKYSTRTGRRLLQDKKPPCPAGKFRSTTNGACVVCPSGRTSYRGSQSATQCFCKPGFKIPNGIEVSDQNYECELCQLGNFFCPGGHVEDFDVFIAELADTDLTHENQQNDCGNGFSPNADASCPCADGTSTILPLAAERTSCIPEAGRRYKKASLQQTEQCDEEYNSITVWIRGDKYDESCQRECVNGGINTNEDSGCRCDPALYTWDANEKRCRCRDGYFDSDGVCQICTPNWFCKLGIRTKCPYGMISPQGSTKQEQCVCELGYYKTWNYNQTDICLVCPVGSYCNGIRRFHCDDYTGLLCREIGLSSPRVCPLGKIFSEGRFSAPECKSPVPNNMLLYINHIQVYGDGEYNVTNPAIQDAVINFNIDQTLGCEGYDNTDFVVVMAASVQPFCGANGGVIVAQDSAGEDALKGALKCFFEFDLGQSFSSTRRFLVRDSDVGVDSIFDPHAAKHNTKANMLLAESHLTWTTFWDCATACNISQGSSALCSSELQICTDLVRCNEASAAASTAKYLVLNHYNPAMSYSFDTDDDIVLPISLDAPTQLAWCNELGNKKCDSVAMLLIQRGDGFSILLHHDNSVGREFKQKIPILGHTVNFALHMPTWRYGVDFIPVILLGLCSGGDSFLIVYRPNEKSILPVYLSDLLSLRGTDTLFCTAPGDALHVSIDGYFLRFSKRKSFQLFELNLQNLEAFLRNGIRTIFLNQYFRTYTLSEQQQSQYSTRTIEDVHYHSTCASIFDTKFASISKCPYDMFALTGDATNASVMDFGKFSYAPNTLEPCEIDDNYKFYSLSYHKIFSSSDIVNNAQIQEEAQRRFNFKNTLSGYKISKFTVLNMEKYQDISNPTPENIDVVVAMENPEQQLMTGKRTCFFVMARILADSVVDFKLLSPFFVQGSILRLQYSTFYMSQHPTYKNLLSVQGRMTLMHATNNVYVADHFIFSCPACTGKNMRGADDEENCLCESGMAPLCLPCDGHCSAEFFTFEPRISQCIHPLTDETTAVDTNGYEFHCVPCTGDIFCDGGSVQGVQTCPENMYSVADVTASSRDCSCDSGYKLDSGSDGDMIDTPDTLIFTATSSQPGTQTCIACDTNEICNPFLSRQSKTSTCFENSFLNETQKYSLGGLAITQECMCSPGFFSTDTKTVLIGESKNFNGMLSYVWNNSSPISKLTPRSYFQKNNVCKQCPEDWYCSHNDAHKCIENSTSPRESASASDCVCNPGFRYVAGVCQACQESSTKYCLHGMELPCNSVETYAYCSCPELNPATKTKTVRLWTNAGHGDAVFQCAACPEDHYCPDSSNPYKKNEIVRCHANSKSSPGSRDASDCVCEAGFYAPFGVHHCSPCPPNFFCEKGTEKPTPCKPGTQSSAMSTDRQDCKCKHNTEKDFLMETKNRGCNCKLGSLANGDDCQQCDVAGMEYNATQKCDCAPGFFRASKYSLLTIKNMVDRQLARSHPFSKDYEIAMQQWSSFYLEAEMLKTNTMDDKLFGRCFLCPPSIICHGGEAVEEMTQIVGKRRMYSILPMGVASTTWLKPCPGSEPHVHHHNTHMVGLSSCFFEATTWTQKETFPFPLASFHRPVGFMLYDQTQENATESFVLKIINGDPAARKITTRTLDESQIYSGFINGIVALQTTINIPLVLSQFFEKTKLSVNAVDVMKRISEIDEGTGIAFDILIQILWAVFVKADVSETSYHSIEPLVFVNSVVANYISRSVAINTVDFVSHIMHQGSLPSPRVLFSHTMMEFDLSLFHGKSLQYMHHHMCSPEFENQNIDCENKMQALVSSSYNAKNFTIQYKNNMDLIVNEQKKLYSTLGFFQKLYLNQESFCPRFTTRSNANSRHTKCSSCPVNKFYSQEESKCMPCVTLPHDACPGFSSQGIPCTPTHDTACLLNI